MQRDELEFQYYRLKNELRDAQREGCLAYAVIVVLLLLLSWFWIERAYPGPTIDRTGELEGIDRPYTAPQADAQYTFTEEEIPDSAKGSHDVP